LGRYDEWKKIVGKYPLEGSNNGYGDGNSETPETFNKKLNNNNFGEMLSPLKESL
jgi:hypothetical protein